ncbi:antitoxin Xre-like helix-turn-helix domain-containing protein [Uliginosibacterium sp. H3]|uniref:Antitoxin Xre-like helix-turn-helix domain-containing protein n=1 Tax=Uliginosibacterium silvisoli TaxID=3114758 RepID=A0ABU6K063_9RHOO|nr:antitoxin Xre-like helix-turn-helix domain-containing protein [Uliginosibacterium sp. H3]
MTNAEIRSAAEQASEPATVLSKAVVRTAEQLGLSQARLAKVLGVSAATASRLVAGRYRLQTDSKEWEFAVLLVRLFRSLDSIVGTQEAARTWLNGENLALAGKPVELMQATEGLVRVVQYLDASRARI